MTAGRIWLACGMALLAFTVPVTAQGRYGRYQERFPSVALMAGPAQYDFGAAGTGTGFAAALRFDVPSGRIFVVEPGISLGRYRSAVGDRISYILPEISLQVEPPRGAIRPYVGVGGGFAEYLSGRGTTYGTLHATAGLRINVGAHYGARLEVRARSIDPFSRSTTDFTFGFMKRLSPSR